MQMPRKQIILKCMLAYMQQSPPPTDITTAQVKAMSTRIAHSRYENMAAYIDEQLTRISRQFRGKHMSITPKTRIVRITLDVELMALPREEWDDETMEADEEVSADWPLDELSSSHEVAECVEQATYDPEMFAGSMLFLKVAETRVVSHSFVDQRITRE